MKPSHTPSFTLSAFTLSCGIAIATPVVQADPVGDVLGSVLAPVSDGLPIDTSAVTGLTSALPSLPAAPNLPVDTSTLTGLVGNGLPGLDALPLDPSAVTGLVGGGLPALDGLPVDPSTVTNLINGGLPSLDGLPVDPSTVTDVVAGALPSPGGLPLDSTAVLGLVGPAISSLNGLPVNPGNLGDSLPGLNNLPSLTDLPLDASSLPSVREALPVDPSTLTDALADMTPDQFNDLINGLDLSVLDDARLQALSIAGAAGIPVPVALDSFTNPAVLKNRLTNLDQEQLTKLIGNLSPELALQLIQNNLDNAL